MWLYLYVKPATEKTLRSKLNLTYRGISFTLAASTFLSARKAGLLVYHVTREVVALGLPQVLVPLRKYGATVIGFAMKIGTNLWLHTKF